jgi:hypothetical protein
MTAAAVPLGNHSGGAPWRPLGVLTLVVFAGHLLILQAPPDRMAPPMDKEAAKVFTTRSIAAPPAVQPAPAVAAMVQAPIPQKAVSKKPLRQEIRGPDATDFVANVLPENTGPTPVDTETPSTSTPVASTPTVAAISAPPLSAPPTAALQPDPAPPVSAAQPSTGPKPTMVTAISLPGSARLQYKVVGTSKGLNYFADAELNWSNTGSRYDATMKVSALFVGSRSMTSSGAVTPTGLAPTRFADKYKSELAAHFEADKGKVTFSANTPEVPWMEGAQDRVSVFLQLGGMLAAGPGGVAGPAGFAVGSSITVYTVGPRDADTWTFLVEATEQLSLPGGDMAALKLTRKPRREYDQKVEVWYAPSLGYLPVRNRITQANGDFVDQQLKAIVRP